MHHVSLTRAVSQLRVVSGVRTSKPKFLRGCIMSITVDFEVTGAHGLESCMGLCRFAKRKYLHCDNVWKLSSSAIT